MIVNFKTFCELQESLQTAKAFDMRELLPMEARKKLQSDEYTLYKDGEVFKSSLFDETTSLFDKTTWYEIFYKDVSMGIIGLNSMYVFFKEHGIDDDYYKDVLYVDTLELKEESKKRFPEMGMFEFVRSVLDWVILYCRKNNFKSIMCYPKTKLHKKMYMRAGFEEDEEFPDFLMKILKGQTKTFIRGLLSVKCETINKLVYKKQKKDENSICDIVDIRMRDNGSLLIIYVDEGALDKFKEAYPEKDIIDAKGRDCFRMHVTPEIFLKDKNLRLFFNTLADFYEIKLPGDFFNFLDNLDED